MKRPDSTGRGKAHKRLMTYNRPLLPQVAVLLLILCLIWFALPGCATEKTPTAGQVIFHFIDVGQGDASLITTPAGNILIDAGPNEAELSLESYLELCGITEIDYLLLTHPHEDHIGGADMILSRFPVDTVILTGAQADSVVAQRLYEAIEKAGCRVMTATPGLTVTLGDVRITVLGPGEEAVSETGAAVSESGEGGNDSSMIIRVDYGQVSALYMGDAEAEAEAWLLDTWQDSGLLDCDILKLGHHGSASSSTEAFLRAVTPAFGIVSAGAGNPYGHPAASVLCRLEALGITCLRTDTGGPIRLTTDGETLWQADGGYAVSGTMYLHEDGCFFGVPIEYPWRLSFRVSLILDLPDPSISSPSDAGPFLVASIIPSPLYL